MVNLSFGQSIIKLGTIAQYRMLSEYLQIKSGRLNLTKTGFFLNTLINQRHTSYWYDDNTMWGNCLIIDVLATKMNHGEDLRLRRFVLFYLLE